MKKSLYKTWLLSLVFLFSLASSVSAFDYYGNGLGYYKLDGGISSGYFANYASNLTFNGKYYQMASAFSGGFSIWNDSEANLLPLPSGSTSTPKISAFSSSFASKPDLYGFTHFYKNGTMISGQYGDGNGPSGNWDKAYVFLNVDALHAYQGTGMDFVQVRAVTMHEIGHAFGLRHFYGLATIMDNTSDPTTKKMKIFDKGWTVPQTDDLNGVNNLY